MLPTLISNYEDFCKGLLTAGFSMGSPNDEGIFSLLARADSRLQWCSTDSEVSTWHWRGRILAERSDLVCGNVFLRKSGWITYEWLPFFISVRRRGLEIQELYANGLISVQEKEVYEYIEHHEHATLHDIKKGVSRGKSSEFTSALTSLQMKLLITISGETQRISKRGEPYGWAVNTYCTMLQAFGPHILEEVQDIDHAEARACIVDQIMRLNPLASERAIARFLRS